MESNVQTDTPFIAQVQRHGKRRSRRGMGGIAGKRQAMNELSEQLEHDHVMESFDPDATPSTAPTLAAYYRDRYHMHRQATQLEQSRKAWNPSYWYVLHHLGNQSLTDCGQADVVDAFIETMRRTGSIRFDSRTGQAMQVLGRPLSDGSINVALQALGTIVNLAFEEGVVQAPPVIRKLKTNRQVPVVPSVEDIRKLLAGAQTLADKAPYLIEVIFLTMDTGLRRRELFELKWKDVDFDLETIHVHRDGRERLSDGIGYMQRHAKERTVPMTRRVKRILEHLQVHVPNGDDDCIIPNTNGAPYLPVDNSYRKGFRGFDMTVKKAGLTGRVTFSGLRDLFAYRLLSQGVSLPYVADLMGYDRERNAVDRYGHWVAENPSASTEFARQWFEMGDSAGDGE